MLLCVGDCKKVKKKKSKLFTFSNGTQKRTLVNHEECIVSTAVWQKALLGMLNSKKSSLYSLSHLWVTLDWSSKCFIKACLSTPLSSGKLEISFYEWAFVVPTMNHCCDSQCNTYCSFNSFVSSSFHWQQRRQFAQIVWYDFLCICLAILPHA